MSVDSMTGFGRSQGTLGDLSWHWELRSVNGRGLDVRLRLPSGFDGLEQAIRARISETFSRGNITANLSTKRSGTDFDIHLDEEVLQQVLQAVEKIRQLTGAPAPTAEGLINTKGILDIKERTETDEALKQKQSAIIDSFDQAALELKTARQAEGEKLAKIIHTQFTEIETCNDNIKATAAAQPQAIAERLKQQINTLLGDENTLQPDRLHQEVAILLTKADISEETARIDAHIEGGRELLQQAGPVGRKLDFLTQEFNREANTICSKSNDITITRQGLAMKAAIDQMREQVQNVE